MRIASCCPGAAALALAANAWATGIATQDAQEIGGHAQLPHALMTDSHPTSASRRDGKPLHVDTALEERVREFLERFVDADKTPAEQTAFFTDDVEYYELGAIGKAAIQRDVAHYARRWPYRHYEVVDVPYIALDPLEDKAFVRYTVDYEVGNAARTVRGAAFYGAVITALSTDPKIEWIKENIIGRGKAGALPDDEMPVPRQGGSGPDRR